MPNIYIEEKDLTTPGSVMESTDVVFIPGFVDVSQASLNSNGAYIGIAANDPQLFTSLSAFEAACGAAAPTFLEDQPYPADFDEKAVPTSQNNVFIKAGSPDPSYIMAKELLAAGLPVLYQRVNDGADSITVVYEAVPAADVSFYIGKTPTDNDPDYYYKEGSEYPSYKDVVSYPNFESIKNEAGDLNVFAIKELPYTDAVEFYNGEEVTYYVLDGEVIAGGEGVDTTLPTFKDSVLIKNAEGFYSYVCDQTEVPEKLTLENDGSVYALAIFQAARPADWNVNYTHYFESGFVAEGSTKIKYTNISQIETARKNYEAGNIYVKTETKDYSVTVEGMYEALDKIFSIQDDANSNVSGLLDRGNHSVKYLTSGGYPVFECGTLANAMLKLAEARGDCVALIDHTDFRARTLNPSHPDSLYQAVVNAKGTTLAAGEFGAMFTPWATYARITNDANEPETPNTFRAPGSFAYLASLADSIKTNANWLAIAGVARGGIKNLAEMTTIVPNGVADKVQPRNNISINAITNIKPYGYTIWGNRTLKDNAGNGNLVATSFLNVRNLISDIKKTCYRAARKLTFEQDTDVLWINFKSEISKLLDQMKSGYGISGYKILRDNTHVRANDKATLCAKVIIYPVEAVEDFYITIVLKDDAVTVN